MADAAPPVTSWTTEAENPATRGIDTLPAAEIVRLMNEQDQVAVDAVTAVLPRVATAVERVAGALRSGGRLFYVGAGTSGRLGVLDASECPPTFHTTPDQVQAVIAGGEVALRHAVEDAEDDEEAGAQAMAGVTSRDVVVGISVSGQAPFVGGALTAARRAGAWTVLLACVPEPIMGPRAHHTILPLTGPEVVAGSTRLKGGTATKMVLNMLTTGAMILVGKVHDNLMVDLRATNRKLRVRARRLVERLAGVDEGRAAELLAAAGWRVKTAVVMARGAMDAAAAEELLTRSGGFLRRALTALAGAGRD